MQTLLTSTGRSLVAVFPDAGNVCPTLPAIGLAAAEPSFPVLEQLQLSGVCLLCLARLGCGSLLEPVSDARCLLPVACFLSATLGCRPVYSQLGG